MSERARYFVEDWIRQFVRVDHAEDPIQLLDSRVDVIACFEAALAAGMSRKEIREEFENLVLHIAAARHRLSTIASLDESNGEETR